MVTHGSQRVKNIIFFVRDIDCFYQKTNQTTDGENLMRKKGEMEGHLLLLKDRSITGLNCFITCTPTATVHVVLKLIFINLEIECVLMYIMVIKDVIIFCWTTTVLRR